MKARCTYCGLSWGVSVRQEISENGYECPWCASKRKRAQKRWQSQKGLNKKVS